MEYIITYKGEHFTPLKPDINQIHIEDIAHSLSLMCRANGHIDHFFSVAQHCINCAVEAKARGFTARVQLACLLHDASEAYISDITRPVKYYLEEYKIIEQQLQNIIYTKYLGAPLPEEEFALMNQIDNDMLVFELNALMKEKNTFGETPLLLSKPSIEYKPQTETENKFQQLYYAILHAGIIRGK